MIYFKKLHIVLLFFFVSISCIAQTKESNSKYSKGISYVDKNNYAKAIEEFKECLKIDTVASLTFNLGINSHDWVAYCYFKLGEIDSAKYYSDFYKYRPYNRFEIEGVDSIYGRGIECSRKKNYKEALECMNEVEQKIVSIYGSKNMHLNKIWIEQAKLQYMLNHHPNAINILTKVWYNYNDSLGPCKNWKKVGDLLLRCYYDEGKRENYLQSERLDSNTVIIKRTDAYKTGLFFIGENSDITLILPMEYESIHKIDERFLLVDVDFDRHFIFDFSNWRHSQPFSESTIYRHICDAKGIPVFQGFNAIVGFDGRIIEYPMSLSYDSIQGENVYFNLDSVRFYVHKDSIFNPINAIRNVFPYVKSGLYGDYQILSLFNKNQIVAYTNSNTETVGLFRILGDKIEKVLPCEYDNISQLWESYFIANKGEKCYIVESSTRKMKKLKNTLDSWEVRCGKEDSIIVIEYEGRKLFKFGIYREMLVGLDGSVYHLPIGVTLAKYKDQFFYENRDFGIKIPFDRLPLGRFTECRFFDAELNKCVPNWRWSANMDFPIDDTMLSKNIKNWMSEMLEGINYTYVPIGIHSPLRMYEHNAKQLMNNNMIVGQNLSKILYLSNYSINNDDDREREHLEDYDAYRLWEDKNYVTYICGTAWYGGGPHGSQTCKLTTFDKQTGKCMKPDDILEIRHLDKLYKIVSNHLVKTIANQSYWTEEDALKYLESNNKYNNKYWLIKNVALTPQGISFYYNDGSFMGDINMIVPYTDIQSEMKVIPMSNNVQFVYIESLANAFNYNKDVKIKIEEKEYPTLKKINISKKLYGINSGEHLLSVIDLANDLYEKETLKASKLISQYLQSVQENVGEESNAYIKGSILSLKCSMKIGDYYLAIQKGLKLKSIYDKIYMYEDRNYAELYALLAKAYFKTNLPDSALFYQEQCLLHENYPEITKVMNAAEYAYSCNQIQKAVSYTKQVFTDIWSDYYSQNSISWQGSILSRFKESTSLERKDLRDEIIPWFQNFLPQIATSSQDSVIMLNTYDALLLSKNILLNIEQSMRNMILSSQDTTIIRPYMQMQNAKQQLMLLANNKTMDGKIRLERMSMMAETIRRLESDLIHKSKVFGDYSKQLQIKTTDVQRNLRSNEIAIEFANSFDSIYYALVLSSEKKPPTIIKLCSSAELRVESPNLYKLIWEPILSVINDVSSIYFSPTGELYKLPIEYVSNTSGEYLNEIYDIYRLSSTREIVLSRDSTFTSNLESNDNAILYGYIDYYADKLFSKKTAKRLRQQNKKHSIRTNLKRAGLLRSNVERLKYTEKEISDIDSLMRINKYAKVDAIYKNEAGTESSIKSYSGSRIKILHLATHGFYITKSEMDNFKTVDFLSLDSMNIDDIEDKELVRSGLLFAGANHTLESDGVIPEDADDGILTSLEVASLDLFGLDLVVLSACQTAQGDLTDDGVMGLQRGFKKAGAHSILMSLWKVNDEATQILMTQFYKNLTVGKSKRESLISAQKYLRMYNNGIYSNPEYWAAFILLDGIK